MFCLKKQFVLYLKIICLSGNSTISGKNNFQHSQDLNIALATLCIFKKMFFHMHHLAVNETGKQQVPNVGTEPGPGR